jgi:hypothetical protein
MAVTAITAYYVVRLGHAPDWRAYADYVFSFRAGFASVPIDHHGAVWLLIAVCCALVTVLVATVGIGTQKSEVGPDGITTESSAGAPSGLPPASCLLPTGLPLLGATAAFWALGSYFAGRSLDSHVGSLSVVFCIAIAFALSLCARRHHDPGRAIAKAAFVPVLAMLVAIPWSDRAQLSDLATHLRWSARDADRLVPEPDEPIENLLRTAGVRSDDPLLFVGMDVPPWRPRGAEAIAGLGEAARLMPRAWLPTLPFSLFYPLPDARSRVYVARFVARRPMSGWLLETKDRPQILPGPVGADPIGWFYEELRRTHRPRRAFANDQWRLTWFEPDY